MNGLAVNTVEGPIGVERLGLTLMHEHVLLRSPEIALNCTDGWEPDGGVVAIREQLRGLVAAGVGTLVDLTVLGLGRDVELVRRAVAGSGLNVIVATGFYTFDELPVYFRRRGPGTPNGGPETLEELFVRDIEDGVAATGVRAGILKCATDARGVTEDVERVLRAVARAHRRTGVPVTTHTHAASRGGLDQQRILREEGVDLGRVIIGHCGDTTDLRYLNALLEAGSYVGMDRFGMDNILPTADRVAVVAELARRGYASRMLLSHDAACWSENWEPGVRERLLPDWHMGFLLAAVVPALLEAGLTQEHIDQMLIRNPADIFARQTPY